MLWLGWHTELRNILIHRISEITDVSFLEALKTIIDAKSESIVLPLTTEQRNEILASKKEIAKGQYIDNDDLEIEVGGWLNTIIWSHRAKIKLYAILEFYTERNKSKAYFCQAVRKIESRS